MDHAKSRRALSVRPQLTLLLESRQGPYAFGLLLAALLAILPSLIWPDFLRPSEGASTSRVEAELLLFKLLVSPTVPASALGFWRPEYTRFAFPDGITTEAVASSPQSSIALQYIYLGLPCWLILLLLTFEAAQFLSRRERGRAPSRRPGSGA